MNAPSLLVFRHLPLGGLAIAAAILGWLLINSSDSSVSNTHDDWRRTANGWERTTDWPRAAAAVSKQPRIRARSQPSIRFDTHPAALALGQLTAILLALFAWPASKRPAKTGWLSAITRSFRASFFGL